MAKSTLGFCLNLRNFIHPPSHYFSTILRIHCYNRDLAVAPHSQESTSASVPQTCCFRSRPFPDLLQRRAKLHDKPLCGVLALNVILPFLDISSSRVIYISLLAFLTFHSFLSPLKMNFLIFSQLKSLLPQITHCCFPRLQLKSCFLVVTCY